MEKLFEDSEFIAERFSCSCLDHHHILDISVEFLPERVIGDKVEINFSWSTHSGEMALWERVKKAFKVLLKREHLDCNISLMPRDIDDIIDLLERAKKK